MKAKVEAQLEGYCHHKKFMEKMADWMAGAARQAHAVADLYDAARDGDYTGPLPAQTGFDNVQAVAALFATNKCPCNKE